MNYKYSCVIDSGNLYKTFVLVQEAIDPESGEQKYEIQHYTLSEGESLVDSMPPTFRPHAGAAGFIEPKWNADSFNWVEGATDEEIAAWEVAHPNPVSLADAKSQRQGVNKEALARYLSSHPLIWSDGQTYGVTEEDQNELALNLMQYQVATQAGQAATLEWHAQKQECRVFTLEEYTALSLAIATYVYPYRRYQEQIKAAIYASKTVDEVNSIAIDYEGVSNVPQTA